MKLKTALLAAPAVLALSAAPSFAAPGDPVSDQIMAAIGFDSVSTDVVGALVILATLAGAFFVYRYLKRTSSK